MDYSIAQKTKEDNFNHEIIALPEYKSMIQFYKTVAELESKILDFEELEIKQPFFSIYDCREEMLKIKHNHERFSEKYGGTNIKELKELLKTSDKIIKMYEKQKKHEV